ncbi:MAG: hypothetical protein ABJC74_02010 [Gemmatimonadota bacterium]
MSGAIGAVLMLLPLRSAPAQCPPGATDSTIASSVRALWFGSERGFIGSLSRLTWNGPTASWHVVEEGDSAWNAGASAYYVEPHLRMALALAEATSDTSVLSDLSGYFIAFAGNLRPMQDVVARQANSIGPASAFVPGRPADRLLPWLDTRAHPARPTECQVCSTQFFHPAARLVRLIAATPAPQRSPIMLQFIQLYVPLLLNDHLLRLGFDHDGSKSTGLVPGWERAIDNPRFQIRDADLWLIATAAELLGAHHLAPDLVPLADGQPLLERMVGSGWRLLVRRASAHPATRNSGGQTVGSLDFFEGDFDGIDDNKFVGYSDSMMPEGQAARPSVKGGWDISHVQRLPVFLRSLWDNRAALGSPGPDIGFLGQTVNQYLYVAFNGRPELPQFHNFFDGTDGWYRVDYSGRRGWGYPPSGYCDNRDRNRPCLSRWGPVGWGLLAFVNPDLTGVGHDLLKLAADSAVSGSAFRQRVYALGADDFRWNYPPGKTSSPLLAEILAEFLSGVRVEGGPGHFCPAAGAGR